jgi:hypothetical protein
MSKTATLGLVKPTHGINEVEGQDPSGESNEAMNLDKIDVAIALVNTTLSGLGASVGPGSVPTYAADGAITQKLGTVTISKGSAAAMTLAAPTSGTDDGKHLTILSTTAFAHVVTGAAGFNGGANHTATFGAAVGNMLKLVAIGGVWYEEPSTGITLST